MPWRPGLLPVAMVAGLLAGMVVNVLFLAFPDLRPVDGLHEGIYGLCANVPVLVAVSREDGSGTRSAFDGTVLGIHKVTHTAVVMPSSEAARQRV